MERLNGGEKSCDLFRWRFTIYNEAIHEHNSGENKY